MNLQGMLIDRIENRILVGIIDLTGYDGSRRLGRHQ